VLTAALLTSGPASGQEDQRGPYQFADTAALRTTETELRAGVQVELVNNTTVGRSLQVRVAGFELKREKGSGKGGVAVTRGIKLPAAGRAGATLSLPSGVKLVGGTYLGEIVVYEARGPVIRRDVALVVPGGKAAEPGVKTLALRAERTIPGGLWLRHRSLPLDASTGSDAKKLELRAGQVLGRVSGSNGGTATVSWTGESRLDGKALVLELEADGFDRPGTYTGAVDLVPTDKEAGEVAVSAAYTHLVVWPVLFLVLGVFAAIGVQAITQVWGIHLTGLARVPRLVSDNAQRRDVSVAREAFEPRAEVWRLCVGELRRGGRVAQSPSRAG
jgi:hypothetical protein